MFVPKKIIILEDDKTSARLVSAFLESKGYHVVESRDGRSAIELALREKPDLMIVEVLLPGMQGSEVVKQLRTTHAMDDLKVLFLTSLLSKTATAGQEAQLALAGRKYPALSKPFRPDVLEGAVSRLLSDEN